MARDGPSLCQDCDAVSNFASIMLVFVLATVNVEAQSQYDRHVAFDHTLTTAQYL
jgi:hypothetical protein